MKRKLQNKKNAIPVALIFILFISIFFRFYKISTLFPFGMDQEYEIFLVKNILNLSHFPLIGVNAGDTGIYLGPLFIYLTTIPYFLLLGNPLGFAIFASSIGVLTTFIIFKITKIMFSQKTAFFSSFIYASSFLSSFYDRHYWNPTPVPLLSLLIGFFLFKITQGNSKYLYFLATAFAFVFHTHLSLLVFTPLIFWVLIKNKNKFPKKTLLRSFLIFFLFISPLVFFDFRHNFTNSKAVFSMFFNSTQNGSKSSIMERTNIFINFLGRFFWVSPTPDVFTEKGLCQELRSLKKNAYPEVIGLAFIFIIFFIYMHHKLQTLNHNSSAKFVISIFLSAILFVFLYSRSFSEYYLNFLTPYLSILMGVSLSYIWKFVQGEIAVTVFLCIYLVLNLITLFTAKNSYSLNNQKSVLQFAKKYTIDQKYSLEALGDCPRFAGWRYLFEYYNGEPVSSYMDSYFGYLFKQSSYNAPDKIVLLSVIEDTSAPERIQFWQEQKINYLTKFDIIDQKSFANAHVFILEPKK